VVVEEEDEVDLGRLKQEDDEEGLGRGLHAEQLGGGTKCPVLPNLAIVSSRGGPWRAPAAPWRASSSTSSLVVSMEKTTKHTRRGWGAVWVNDLRRRQRRREDAWLGSMWRRGRRRRDEVRLGEEEASRLGRRKRGDWAFGLGFRRLRFCSTDEWPGSTRGWFADRTARAGPPPSFDRGSL
jgi:hypothetical protein